MARAAPQAVARRALAGALRQVLNVARDPRPRRGTRADERDCAIGKPLSGVEFTGVEFRGCARAIHPNLSRKMALLAYAVAPVRWDTGRVHDVGRGRGLRVSCARTMTTLASDSPSANGGVA